MKKKSAKKTKKLPLTQRMKIWHLVVIFLAVAAILTGGLIFKNISERNRKITILKELSSLFDDIKTSLEDQGIELEKEEYCSQAHYSISVGKKFCGVTLKSEKVLETETKKIIEALRETDSFSLVDSSESSSGGLYESYEYRSSKVYCTQRSSYIDGASFYIDCDTRVDLTEFPQ